MINFKPRKFKLTLNNNDPSVDPYFQLAKNASNWRKTAFSLMLIIVLLIFFLANIAMKSTVETFIIEREGNRYTVVGKAEDVARTQDKATDQEIIYFLNEVIYGIKSLSKDSEVYNRNYKKSLVFLSRSAAKKFDNYLKEEKYVDKVKNGKTVEIYFNTGDKISDNTYQIRWRQTTFSKNGEIESNINYSAIVTITFTDMSDPQKVYINPLGLMITDFSQKEEML